MDLSNYQTLNQTRAAERCSSRYAFIPTTRALNVLAERGWFPVKVKEARVRDENRQGFQRHIIRLRNEGENRALALHERFIEAVLINAHDGSGAFSLMSGIHEKVCSNGLIVCTASFGAFRIRHQGFTEEAVFEAIDNITKDAPLVLGQVEKFESLRLSYEEQRAFAESAIELRFDGEKYAVKPEHVLLPRRAADREGVSAVAKANLWTTMNVVQENLLRGGVRQENKETHNRTRSRAVTSITEDTRINKALWKLTEEMARLKNVIQ